MRFLFVFWCLAHSLDNLARNLPSPVSPVWTSRSIINCMNDIGRKGSQHLEELCLSNMANHFSALYLDFFYGKSIDTQTHRALIFFVVDNFRSFFCWLLVPFYFLFIILLYGHVLPIHNIINDTHSSCQRCYILTDTVERHRLLLPIA